MLKTTILAGLAALALGAGAALAQEEARGPTRSGHVTDFSFSFEGPFGRYDQAQLQRGLQVYTEVCSACHGLKFVHLPRARRAGRAGDDRGADARLCRDARGHGPGDRRDPPGDAVGPFRSVSPLENAPDLSLMAKARAGFHGPAGLGINQILHGIGGPEYIASLLHRLHRRGARGGRRRRSTRTRSSPAAGSRWRRR